MESPLKPNVLQNHEEDRISALPEDLLIGILERLDLREALRAGAASARWRHLPHQLSRLDLAAVRFEHRTRATPRAIFEAFTCAAQRFLQSACPKCEHDCERSRIVKTILLSFFLVLDPDDQMASLGRAVEHVVSRGKTERFEFGIYSPYPPSANRTAPHLAEYGQQLMSFSRACPVAFLWLTRLDLQNLALEDSDITDLIKACHKLERLHLAYCTIVESAGPLKIDAPSSELRVLELLDFRCTQLQLISVPKLSQVVCHAWLGEEPLVHFGDDVPSLREVYLSFVAPPGAQTQFSLSELLPRNLSILHLAFGRKMIWIQPEHPKRLTPIFTNMREVYLSGISADCDLSWTLFILEAAPSLQKIHLLRHSCVSDDVEKTNMTWEPSNNFKHLNLKLMVIKGFEQEPEVMNYIRLVMERATCLERIELTCDENLCNACIDFNVEPPRTCAANKVSKHRVWERLTHGFSSPVQIIIS